MNAHIHNATHPLFSVTIPAFKSRFLPECIKSILNQSDKDFELILVDDASPEDLQFVVEKFDDGRIRYFRNDKGFGARNVVGNWNKCLEHARGKYIICMGDDDMLLPDCLADYRALISRHPGLGVYHTRLKFINEKGSVIDLADERPEYESVYSQMWHVFQSKRRQVIGDFLFDVKRLRSIGGFYDLPFAWNSDKLSADYAAWDTGVANTATFGFLYRQNRFNITSNTNHALGKIEALQKSLQWYRNRLRETPSNAVDREIHKSLLELNENFHHEFIGFAAAELIGTSPIKLMQTIGKFSSFGLTKMDALIFFLRNIKTKILGQ